MPINRLAEFSLSAGSNTDIAGVNVAEGMQRNLVNNAIRALTAMLKSDLQSVTPTMTAASTFTLASISTGDWVLMAPYAGVSITSFGATVQGMHKWIEATGESILRHSANLDIQGNADVTLTAGDVVYARARDATNWKAVVFKDSGLATVVTAVTGTIGKHLVPIKSTAMQPHSLSGGTFANVETTTNKHNFRALLFDSSATEYAYYELVMPSSYNSGPITYKVRSESTSGVGGAVWVVDAAAIGNGDSNDPAWGTAQSVTVSYSAANQLNISAESAALTIGNSVTAHDLVQFRVYRSPQDAADTLAADARLRWIDVFITTTAEVDTA